MTITLTKHHGLGNDFLIGIGPERPFTPADAIKWCHRREGVGADGLIMLTPLKLGWQMTLHNSDGSRAELSGNGLRCVGQALAMAQEIVVPEGESHTFAVMTQAGPRGVIVFADSAPGEAQVQVAMGKANPGPDTFDGWAGFGIDPVRQVGVDMGNPHLVVEVADPSVVDLAKVGPAVEANYPDGLNIHFISVRDREAIDLKIWERGAGITEACGSGACAAAYAAHDWDLVDDVVQVHQPGGVATVILADSGVSLRGPATFIATVTV